MPQEPIATVQADNLATAVKQALRAHYEQAVQQGDIDKVRAIHTRMKDSKQCDKLLEGRTSVHIDQLKKLSQMARAADALVLADALETSFEALAGVSLQTPIEEMIAKANVPEPSKKTGIIHSANKSAYRGLSHAYSLPNAPEDSFGYNFCSHHLHAASSSLRAPLIDLFDTIATPAKQHRGEWVEAPWREITVKCGYFRVNPRSNEVGYEPTDYRSTLVIEGDNFRDVVKPYLELLHTQIRPTRARKPVAEKQIVPKEYQAISGPKGLESKKSPEVLEQIKTSLALAKQNPANQREDGGWHVPVAQGKTLAIFCRPYGNKEWLYMHHDSIPTYRELRKTAKSVGWANFLMAQDGPQNDGPSR